MNNYQCSISGCVEVRVSLRSLVQHMRGTHRAEKHCNITCNLDGCPSVLQTVRSFEFHVSSYHKRHWNATCIRYSNSCKRQKLDCEAHTSCESSSAIPDHVLPSPNLSFLDDCDPALAKNSEEAYSECLAFLNERVMDLRLQLESSFMLPVTTVNNIMQEVSSIVTGFKECFSEALDIRLKELKISDDQITSMLLNNVAVNQSFHVTETDRDKRIKELGFIEPVSVLLEKTVANEHTNDEDLSERSSDDSDVSEVETDKQMFAHYVPILQTLKHYLSNEEVCHSILRGSSSNEDGVLCNYADGQIMAEHELFSQDPTALRLKFYADEVELCNPIGSAKGKHKVLCVYFIVDNIEAKYASSLGTIHLALLVKWRYIKEFGYCSAFKALLSDLKILEDDGINISIDGRQVNFKGTLSILSADNLTAHSIGGFSGSFSRGRVCRYCMAHHTDLNLMFRESDTVMRTLSGHLAHIESVKNFPRLRCVYGVHGNCPLGVLKYWDALKCLPPDVMHDLLEGVIPTTLAVVIRGLIETVDAITEQYFNQLLKNFKYSVQDGKSKHPGLPADFCKRNKGIPGSASQKWNLFCFLPYVVGHLVPKDNKYWKLYLLCSEICEIALAPRVLVGFVPLLESAVAEFLELWTAIGKKNVTPKMHYLVHYPRLMTRFGALRSFWCMRFEQFHQFMKQIALRSNNYINITQTLATRFQKRRCLEFSSKNVLPAEFVINSAQQSVRIENLPDEVMSKVSGYLGYELGSLLSVKDVTIQGLHVVVGCYLVIDMAQQNKVPVFLRVIYIFKFGTSWLIYGKLTFYKEWDEHLRTYVLDVLYEDEDDEEDDYVCVGPTEILTESALSSYVIDGENHIKLRTEVVARNA